MAQKSDWPRIRAMVLVLESFDFIFSAHLMVTILGYTNDFSLCLQRRDQDILNALSIVSVAKNKMQQLRSDGWGVFLQRVNLFCNKHDIKFLKWMIIMCLLEDQLGLFQSKQMMITLEEKYILASLIELFKSLILGLMRLIWSYFLVWKP
uniref:Uncharacterized protein n=1 Tax=Arundo donax TaxID=35708 RepID=A0A0A9DYN0_ARUDO